MTSSVASSSHSAPAASARARVTPCSYQPPLSSPMDYAFFSDLKEKANDPATTFGEVRAFVEENKRSWYQFFSKFEVSLEKKDNFVRVLQVKAQEAHRFVPTIKGCAYIESAHLGFTRNLTFHETDTSAIEHILVDNDALTVIFIEEAIISGSSRSPGRFVAVNRLVEELGRWYFEITYLYAEQPAMAKIGEMMQMLTATKKAMLDFADDYELESVYAALKPLSAN